MGNSLNTVSFEEASKMFPRTIYKYRESDDPKHRTVLSERQVYFAPPSSFKDQFDCKIPIRYDLLTERQLYEVYYIVSKERNSNFTRQQHRKDAREWVKKSPIKNPRHLEQTKEEGFNALNNSLGVLCLTEDCNNNYMWNKYSENHAGFVVGFNPLIMFKFLGGGGQVKYYEKLPNILPRPVTSYEEQWRLQVYSKLKIWENEKEYRVQKLDFISPHDERRKINLPIEAFSEIIFGAKITADNKNEIREIIKNTMPHIKIRQATYKNPDELKIYDE